MKLPRRNFLRLAEGAAALPAVTRFARAQSYPTRPVRLLIGFAPPTGSTSRGPIRAIDGSTQALAPAARLRNRRL